jgi:hypothetical protein
LAVALAAVAFCCWATFTTIDRPGLQYDETAFVNAALGADHPDQHFVHDRFHGVVTKIFPYIGALKSWLYAPIFSVFGTSIETIRIPAVLLGLIAIGLACWLALRLFGAWPAALLALLLATDPAFPTMAKADWGPIVIGGLLRVAALVAYFALLRTRSLRYAWVLGAVLLLGIFNKVDFVWFLASIGLAALLVHWRELWAIARGRPLAAALPAALFLGVLALLSVTSILPAREVAAPTGSQTLSERLDHRWALFADTFDGTGLYGYMVGIPLEPGTPAPAIYAGALALALVAIVLAVASRGRFPRGEARLVAFFLVQIAVIAAFVVGTRQVGGAHHLIQLWPLPQLLVVSLAVLGWKLGPRALRLGATGIVAVALAWLLVMQVAVTTEFHEAFEGDTFTHVWTPEIYELSDRAGRLGSQVDGVVAADWGIGPQVFALNGDAVRERFRDLPGEFAAAGGPAGPMAAAAHLQGRRVLVMFHHEAKEIFPGSTRGVGTAIEALGPAARVREVYSGEVLRAYLVDSRQPPG